MASENADRYEIMEKIKKTRESIKESATEEIPMPNSVSHC